MTEGARTQSKPAASPAKQPAWLLPLATLVITAVVLAVLVLGVGAELDAPTIGLALVCAAMIGALRGMWGIYAALARPSAESYIVEAEVAGGSTQVELREEKLRVLRAIKELEFDHAMGKLNDDDFKRIGDAYRLRAIEVLRQLDQDQGELHPLLKEHLDAIGRAQAPAPAAEAPAAEASQEQPS